MNRVYTGSGLERAVWWAWGGRVDNSDIAALLRHLEADLGELMGVSAGRRSAHPN